MSEYTQIAERARPHTPLVPCIACRQAAWVAKYVRRGAVSPTVDCTCTTLQTAPIPDNPDVLWALEWAHAQLCRHPEWCEANHPTMTAHHDALLAAIAKARGSL